MAETTPVERPRALWGGRHTEAFGRRNAVAGELLVRVTPTRAVARKSISG